MPELQHSLQCHCVQCKPCLNVCCENPPVRAGLCCDPSTLGSCLQPFTPRCFAPCCYHSVNIDEKFHINGDYLEEKELNASLVNPLQFMFTDEEEEIFDGLDKSTLNEEEDSVKNDDVEDADSGNGDDDTYLFPFDVATGGSEDKLSISSDEEKEDKSALEKMNEDYRKLDVFMEEFETHPLDDEMKIVRKYVVEGSKTFPNPHLLVGKDCLQCFEQEREKTWYKVKILSVVMENGLDTLFSVQYEDGDGVENYRLFYDLLADLLKVPGWNAPLQLQPKPSSRSDYSSESDYIEDDDHSVQSDEEENLDDKSKENIIHQVSLRIRDEVALDRQIPNKRDEEENGNEMAHKSPIINIEELNEMESNCRREIGKKIVDYSISDEDGNESDLDEGSFQKSEEREAVKGTKESSFIVIKIQDNDLIVAGPSMDDGNLSTEIHSDGKANTELGDTCIKPEPEQQHASEEADNKKLSSSSNENDELEAAFLDIDYEEESEDEDSKEELKTSTEILSKDDDLVVSTKGPVVVEPVDQKAVQPVEWTPDPTLPTGWSHKECPRVNISRNNTKDVYYLSPDGKKFRSRKQVIDYLEKNGATALELLTASKGYLKGCTNRFALQKEEIKKKDEMEEDVFCWGFESFEHELCENQMLDIGESPEEDDEDVYFVLNGKESIVTGKDSEVSLKDENEKLVIKEETEIKYESENNGTAIKEETETETVLVAGECLLNEASNFLSETGVVEIKVELEDLEMGAEEKVLSKAHESQLKQEAGSDQESERYDSVSGRKELETEILDSEKFFIKTEICIEVKKEEPKIVMKVEPIMVSKSHLKKKISVAKLGNQLIHQIQRGKKQIDKILNMKKNFKRKSFIDLNEQPLKKLKLAKEKSSYYCPDCGIIFPTPEILLEHVGKNHIWERLLNKVTDKSPFICPLSSTGQCSYLQRNRKQITEHIIRTGDEVHKEMIINVAKQKYQNFSIENQWKVSLVKESFCKKAESEVEDGTRRGKVPRKNIEKLHRLNPLADKCIDTSLCSDIFQIGRFSAEPTELIVDEGFESGDEVAENIFRISNKFKLKKKKVAPATPEQLKKLGILLRLKEAYSKKVKHVQELRKKKLQPNYPSH